MNIHVCIDVMPMFRILKRNLFTIAVAVLMTAPVTAQVVSGFTPHGGRGATTTITGSGFMGATAVTMGNAAAANFTVDSDNQITATSPTDFVTGPIGVAIGMSAGQSQFHFISRPSPMTVVGPVGQTALPLGVLFNYSPLADNAFGQLGGVTYTFENMTLPANTWVYYGVSGPVGISMDNDQPSGPEIMTYSAIDSNLATGRIVYLGTSQMNLAIGWGPGAAVCTRLVLQFQSYPPSALVPVIAAIDVGLPAELGAVAAIPPGARFAMNLAMEAAYQSDGCVTWQPALQLYDQAPTINGQLAYSNYGTGFYYENTAPELGVIADQIVNDGGATPALALSVADAETTPDGVVFSVTSSDSAFVPVTNVVISGSGATRQVTVTTVAGEMGPSTITIRGTDTAGSFSEEAFVVSLNSPPNITAIADQLVQVGQPTAAIPFTIGDVQTPAASLVVTASSNNQILVPDGNLSLGGIDENRTITATPFGSQTGQATITITVTDSSGLQIADFFTLTVNARPLLTANMAPTVPQGQAVVLSTANLNASDIESGPTEIRYTLNPDGNTTAGRFGVVQLLGVTLGNGGTFTQQDIIDGNVSFLHDDSCNAPGEYNFDIDDTDGGFGRAPLSPYLAGINVTLRNDAPSASPLAISVAIGGTIDAQLEGTDDDCLSTDTLSFTHILASGPSRGTVTALDPSTGAFTYVATAGQSGADSFQFEVNDGTTTVTETVTITIENQTPFATPATLVTTERTGVSSMLAATDLDLPAQPLQFSIASPPTKGTISALNAMTGEFTYTPAVNRIGSDSFTFTASDGALMSTPAIVDIDIRPIIDYGDIAVADKSSGPGNSGKVVIVDPVSGDQSVLANGGLLSGSNGALQGIAFEANGNIVATSSADQLLRIDSATGLVSLLADIGSLALGVAVDVDSTILVANGPSGVLRVDPTTGNVLATYTGSTLQVATDVDVLDDGRIVVTDAGVFGAGPNQLLILDPVFATETVVSVPSLVFPLSVVRFSDGRVAVGDGLPEFGAWPSTIQIVDLDDGSVDVTIADAALEGATGVAVDMAGNLYSTSREQDHVLRHDLIGGAPTVVTSGAPLEQAWGLAVYGERDPILPIGIFSDGFEIGGATLTAPGMPQAIH